MRVHVLQHVPFEGIGSIDAWLKRHQASITYTRFFEQSILPQLNGLDLLIVMGGPMSVNDEAAYPWLRPEKQLLRDAVALQVPTLGICLGAQLIANALGAAVSPNAQKEIGWFPVTAVRHEGAVFALPELCDAFHWHGETFGLPRGAVQLARSEACENQAFQLGRRVIGLQFHLEATPESVRSLVNNCRGDLTPGPFVQNEEELLHVEDAVYERANRVMDTLLSYLSGVE